MYNIDIVHAPFMHFVCSLHASFMQFTCDSLLLFFWVCGQFWDLNYLRLEIQLLELIVENHVLLQANSKMQYAANILHLKLILSI